MAKSILSRALAAAGGAAANKSCPDVSLAKSHPIMHELMTALVDDDGKPRQTSSLLVFMEDGTWKAMLKEREMHLQLWASGGGLMAVLDAIEHRLGQDPPEWRREQTNGYRRK